MQVSRAHHIARLKFVAVFPREIHHLLRDSRVDGGEDVPDGGERLVSSNSGKRNAPGNPACGRHVKAGRKASRIARSGETQPELPCEGWSVRRLVIVQKSAQRAAKLAATLL